MTSTKRDKIIEWVRWGLAVLVIPLAIWGIKLETNNAVQNERIAELQKHKDEHSKSSDSRIEKLEQALGVVAEQIKRLQDDLKEARGMRSAIQANTNALGKLEVKIDAVYTNISEIKVLLRQP